MGITAMDIGRMGITAMDIDDTGGDDFPIVHFFDARPTIGAGRFFDHPRASRFGARLAKFPSAAERAAEFFGLQRPRGEDRIRSLGILGSAWGPWFGSGGHDQPGGGQSIIVGVYLVMT